MAASGCVGECRWAEQSFRLISVIRGNLSIQRARFPLPLPLVHAQDVNPCAARSLAGDLRNLVATRKFQLLQPSVKLYHSAETDAVVHIVDGVLCALL